jgi:hypothetical protein
MPDSVAQRLDTVLAAEVARRDTAREVTAQTDGAERAGGDGMRESPAPRRPGGNRGFRLLTLRVLAPVAAVVVLGAGVYGLTRINLGSSTGSSASTAEGGAARAATPAAEGSAKSAGRANAPVARPAQRTGPQGRITAANFSLVTGHQNLTRARLAQQVRAELLVPAAQRTTKTPSGQLRGCVARLAGHQPVELVENVYFEGSPATLVVAFTGAGDTAWIAGPDCSATQRDVLASASLRSGISGP